MSNAASSYAGSKISLISKAGIRYEGILYNIDTNESTVALSNVKSFGTEDRNPERPVLPRDQIYEFIIFRSSDICDLHVCEPPKQEPQIYNQDPAIVTISQNVPKPPTAPVVPSIAPTPPAVQIQEPAINPTPLFSPNELQKASSNISSEPYYPTHSADVNTESGGVGGGTGGVIGSNNTGRREANRPQHFTQNNRGGSGSASNNYSRNYDHYEENENRYHRDAAPARQSRGNYASAVSRGGNSYHTSDNTDYNSGGGYRQNYRNNQYDQNVSSGGRGSVGRYNRISSNVQHQDYGNRRGGAGDSSSGRGSYNMRGGSYTRGGGNGSAHGIKTRNGNSNQQFTDDYDFEAENAKMAEVLAKVSITGDEHKEHDSHPASSQDADEEEYHETESNPPKDAQCEDVNAANFYDKKKSFFDTISSESADRAKGVRPVQMNRREEQRVNVETFGTVGHPGSGGGGGGYYRGGNRNNYYDRNRMYYRGGRGGGGGHHGMSDMSVAVGGPRRNQGGGGGSGWRQSQHY